MMERRQAYQGNYSGSAASCREPTALKRLAVSNSAGLVLYVIKLFDRDEGEEQGCSFGTKKL
jgi:hypothetical protein